MDDQKPDAESQTELLLPPGSNHVVSVTPSPVNSNNFFSESPSETKDFSTTELTSPMGDNVVFVTHPRRWIVLALFVLYSASNAFQWAQYTIISNIIEKYYRVGYHDVDWTAMAYMILYIVLIFPASWFLNKQGLRKAVIIGTLGTAVGSWIKCASIATDRFYVTMIGQCVVATSQIFILGIPPRLASVWFGAKEVSTACAIGVFGNQLGIAFGFLLPPVLVQNSTDDVIAQGLTVLFFGTAAFCTVLSIAIILVFKNAPSSPPSQAAAAAAEEDDNYFQSIKNLVKNKDYILLLISYGVNVGVFYAVSVLLNPVYIKYFPGEEISAGRVGLCIIVAGMIGSFTCGFWLDKYHKYKGTTVGLYVFSFMGMIAFTFIFRVNDQFSVYLVASLLGFFMTAYLPVGFEFGVEITYPESEGTSAGLLNASAQVFGILLILIASELNHNHSDIAANLTLCGFLLFGVVMTVLIKADLKRQRAQQRQTVPPMIEEKTKLANVNAA